MNKNSPPLDTPQFKSFIARIRQFDQKLTAFFLTLLKISLLLAILIGSFHLVSSLNDKAIYIEGPEVPGEFIAQGYSSKVVARMIMDQLGNIRGVATDSIYASKVYGREQETEFRLYEAEGQTKMKDQFISLIKDLFGMSKEKVLSELVLDGNLWSIKLRLPNGRMQSFDLLPQYPSASSKTVIKKEELKALILEASLWLVQNYEPVLVGFYYLHINNYERCLELCRMQTGRSDEEADWLRVVQGMAYTQLGNLPEAEEVLSSDAETGEDFPSLCLARVEAFLMGNDTVQIRSAFEKVTECGAEDDVDFYIYLGNWMVELGQFRQARECFERANEMEPNNSSVLSALAGVLQRVDHLEDAAICFEEAYSLAKDKSRIKDKYTHFLLRQGRMWLQEEREAKAWETYLKTLQISPENKEAKSVFDNYWASMDPLFDQLGIRQVISPDSMSTTVREGWMQFMVQQGIKESESGKLSNAEELFFKVKMVDPNHPGLVNVIEDLYKKQLDQALIAGDFSEFRKKYRLIVREGISGTRLKQAFLPKIKNRIREWEKREDVVQELEAYELWYEWDQSNAGVLMAWAKAYARMGNMELAEEKLLKAYQMNVNLFAVVSIWADLLLEAEQYEKAIEKYSLADKMTPNTFRILRNWGKALNLNREYDDAILKYEASLNALDTMHILPQRMALFQMDAYTDLASCNKAIGNSTVAEDWYARTYRKAMQLLAQSPSINISIQTYLKLARMSASQRETNNMVDWLEEGRRRGLQKQDIPIKDPVFKQYSWKIEEIFRDNEAS